MNSLCQMQQTTTKKSNGTLSLAQIYDIEQLPNDDDAVKFDMDYSVDMIQEYASNHQSIYSRILGEQWYRMSPEEKSIWYELSEAAKDNILVNPKTPGPLVILSRLIRTILIMMTQIIIPPTFTQL